MAYYAEPPANTESILNHTVVGASAIRLPAANDIDEVVIKTRRSKHGSADENGGTNNNNEAAAKANGKLTTVTNNLMLQHQLSNLKTAPVSIATANVINGSFELPQVTRRHGGKQRNSSDQPQPSYYNTSVRSFNLLGKDNTGLLLGSRHSSDRQQKQEPQSSTFSDNGQLTAREPTPAVYLSAAYIGKQPPVSVSKASGNNKRHVGRLSFRDISAGAENKPGQKAKLPFGHVSLQDFWREYTKVTKAAALQRHQEIVCHGQSAIDWETEFKQAQLSRHIILNRALPEITGSTKLSDIVTPHMIVQQSTSGDSNMDPHSLLTRPPRRNHSNLSSEKARKRLLRQLRRRENARKFIVSTKLAEMAAASVGVEPNDDSASVVSSSTGNGSSISGDGSSKHASATSSNGDFEPAVTNPPGVSEAEPSQFRNDTNTVALAAQVVSDAANAALLTAASGVDSSGLFIEPIGAMAEIDGSYSVANMDERLTMALLEASDSQALISQTTVTTPNNPHGSIAPVIEDVPNEASPEPQEPRDLVGVNRPNLAVDALLALIKVSDSTPAPAEYQSPPASNVELEPSCSTCGASLSANPPESSYSPFAGYGSNKRPSNKRNSRAVNQFYGSGTGISTKSALVNWFATRMTSDQMLMVASFEDETANFLFANTRQTILSSGQPQQSVPSGWLPNQKLPGYLSAPVKRRSTIHHHQVSSNLSQLPARNNYFGYHDTRRKLPTSGVFRHYKTPEEHARFYRLQFTVADAGRFAEMWRQSIDPNRHPHHVDEMMLIGPRAHSKSFTIEQSFHDGNDDTGNRRNHHHPHHHKSKHHQNPVEKPPANDSSGGTVESSDATSKARNSGNSTGGNQSGSEVQKPTRQTSDVMAMGSGPVLVWPPHQHPAPVVTLSNATNQAIPAPPGPWPIRPWTLAQLEGKKVLNTKVSMLTNTIKADDSPSASNTSPLVLQPLQQPGSGGTPTGTGTSFPAGNDAANTGNSSPNSSQAQPSGMPVIHGKGARKASLQPLSAALEAQSLQREETQSHITDADLLNISGIGNKKNPANGSGGRIQLLAKHRSIEKAYKRSRLLFPVPNIPPTSASDVSAVVKTLFSTKEEERLINGAMNSQIEGDHKRGGRRRGSNKIKLVPISDHADAEAKEIEQEMESRRSSNFSLPATRPRTSNMPKVGSSSSGSSGGSGLGGHATVFSSLPLNNLTPFGHAASSPSLSKLMSLAPNSHSVVASSTVSSDSLLMKSSASLASLLNASTGAANRNGHGLPKNWSHSDVTHSQHLADENTKASSNPTSSNGNSKYVMLSVQLTPGSNGSESSNAVNNSNYSNSSMKHDLSPRPKLLVTNNGISTGS